MKQPWCGGGDAGGSGGLLAYQPYVMYPQMRPLIYQAQLAAVVEPFGSIEWIHLAAFAGLFCSI